MRPSCVVTVNGRAVSGAVGRRLVECEVVDKDGLSSDTVRLRLDDDPPAEIPALGARIEVAMGYGDAPVPMGSFLVEDVEAECLPYALSITGKAAEMGGPAKEVRRRHWDDASLADVIATIAGDLSVTPAVDAALGAFRYPWLGQITESNVAFLERLAEQHGALFSIKAGRLVFARRGTGESVTGKALTGVVIARDRLVQGTCRMTVTSRSAYRNVKATWMDRASGRKRTVTVEGDSAASADFEIGRPFASEAEAEAAARAKAHGLGRAGLIVTASILGDPTVRAGAAVQFQGVRAGFDGTQLVVEQAVHSFSATGGYKTEITASLKA